MSRTKTKLIAAATVASTAFFASTVAIKTASAATFQYKDPEGLFEKTWMLTSPDASTVDDLFNQIQEFRTEVEWLSGWSAKYGESELRLGQRSLEKRNEAGELNLMLDGWWDIESRVEVLDLHSVGELLGARTRLGDWEKVESVPEPSSAIALGALGVGLVASRRRRRRSKNT